MKSLKPSMRENKRYLLIEGKDLKKNVEKAILDFVGVLGFSKLGLSWIEEKGDYGIISINREMVDSVRASLCVFSKKMEVKKVSGTLKGLKR
jgi:RNase P/RNase MRP subunit POP5